MQTTLVAYMIQSHMRPDEGQLRVEYHSTTAISMQNHTVPSYLEGEIVSEARLLILVSMTPIQTEKIGCDTSYFGYIRFPLGF